MGENVRLRLSDQVSNVRLTDQLATEDARAQLKLNAKHATEGGRIFNNIETPLFLKTFSASYLAFEKLDAQNQDQLREAIETFNNEMSEENKKKDYELRYYEAKLIAFGCREFVNFVKIASTIAYFQIIGPNDRIRPKLLIRLKDAGIEKQESEAFAFDLICSYYNNVIIAYAYEEIRKKNFLPEVETIITAYANKFLSLYGSLDNLRDGVISKVDSKELDVFKGLDDFLYKLEVDCGSDLYCPSVRKKARELIEIIREIRGRMDEKFLIEFVQGAIQIIEHPGNQEYWTVFLGLISQSKTHVPMSYEHKLALLGVGVLAATIVIVAIGLTVVTFGGSLYAGLVAVGLFMKILSISSSGGAFALGVGTLIFATSYKDLRLREKTNALFCEASSNEALNYFIKHNPS
jgi:hypothetical protein